MDFMLLYEDGSTYNSNIKYDRNFINNEYRFSAKSKFGDEMSFNKLTSKLIFNRIDEDSDLRLICDKQAQPLNDYRASASAPVPKETIDAGYDAFYKQDETLDSYDN